MSVLEENKEKIRQNMIEKYRVKKCSDCSHFSKLNKYCMLIDAHEKDMENGLCLDPEYVVKMLLK